MQNACVHVAVTPTTHDKVREAKALKRAKEELERRKVELETRRTALENMDKEALANDEEYQKVWLSAHLLQCACVSRRLNTHCHGCGHSLRSTALECTLLLKKTPNGRQSAWKV